MIPPVAHFIWFGARFPFTNVLAVRSAALAGGFERVVLHYDGQLDNRVLTELKRLRGFEARVIDRARLFERLPYGDALRLVFDDLDKPNARANIIRAAILAQEGGVYLDTDTITIRPFTPLLSASAFCGQERVVWPAEVKNSRSPWVQARALMQDGLRAAFAAAPGGWRTFRRIEGFYPCAVNNAVIGAEAGHPFVSRLLEAMTEVPLERRRVPFALGTHLLQREVAGWDDPKRTVTVHPPPVFYPLSPVISLHWFRGGGPDALAAVLTPETRLVHWYASVHTRRIVPQIDAEYVRSRTERQLFSALARPFVP